MLEKLIISKAVEACLKLYNAALSSEILTVQKTIPAFKQQGDLTLVVFPIVKFSKKSPDITGSEIGDYLKKEIPEIRSFGVVKGFLNLMIDDSYWLKYLIENCSNGNYGFNQINTNEKPVLIEFSSPNTNKPLHLGHIRNNLLGSSVSEILKASGQNVKKVNLVNDRGIHICKSMIAWQKWGNGETPESSGMKGDHLVGKYYVLFDEHYKKEVSSLIAAGNSEEESKKYAPLIIEAQEMLRKWESGNKEIIELWQMMNSWVYAGFEFTYKSLGIDFDKTYYESQTYLLGKDLVLQALSEQKLIKKDDGSVWADMTSEGLDEKILLRADGTSVYMTQDIGTAQLRFEDFNPQKMIYVVGNEQNYHFNVLKKVIKLIGKDYSDTIFHLSYGMVELPEGKMKSREGTVVDADDLIEEMIFTAREMTEELGKTNDFSTEQAQDLYRVIGLGALKYFILKVDPEKNMIFNPSESIDFNGNTGPFIQYTYARIKSLLRKADILETSYSAKTDLKLLPEEKELLMIVYEFPQLVKEAAEKYSPAVVANYVYELAKAYNHFYQRIPVLKEMDKDLVLIRLMLSEFVGEIIKKSLALLGIEVPERM